MVRLTVTLKEETWTYSTMSGKVKGNKGGIECASLCPVYRGWGGGFKDPFLDVREGERERGRENFTKKKDGYSLEVLMEISFGIK